jgi:hypothetical protein
MRHLVGLAVTGILVLASPAAARDQRVEGGEYQLSFERAEQARQALSRQRKKARGPQARPVLLMPVERERFAQARHLPPDLSVREVPATGLPASGTHMVRSVPVASNVQVGVGLFSIVGETEKETLRRRTNPGPDVRPRDRRVGAVGFSLSF